MPRRVAYDRVTGRPGRACTAAAAFARGTIGPG